MIDTNNLTWAGDQASISSEPIRAELSSRSISKIAFFPFNKECPDNAKTRTALSKSLERELKSWLVSNPFHRGELSCSLMVSPDFPLMYGADRFQTQVYSELWRSVSQANRGVLRLKGRERNPINWEKLTSFASLLNPHLSRNLKLRGLLTSVSQKEQGSSSLCPTQMAFLVGGFSPFEKYAYQNGSFPQIGVKINNIWNLLELLLSNTEPQIWKLVKNSFESCRYVSSSSHLLLGTGIPTYIYHTLKQFHVGKYSSPMGRLDLVSRQTACYDKPVWLAKFNNLKKFETQKVMFSGHNSIYNWFLGPSCSNLPCCFMILHQPPPWCPRLQKGSSSSTFMTYESTNEVGVNSNRLIVWEQTRH